MLRPYGAALPVHQFPRPLEHGVEHIFGEPFGLCVVTAAMIRVEQRHTIRQRMFVTVRKFEFKRLQAQRSKGCLVRDHSQRNQHRLWRQSFQFSSQKSIATANLARQRLILRRHAFHAVGDAAIGQRQIVVFGYGLGFAGESETMQRLIQNNSRVIAGERPARGIRAMKAGRQTHDKQARAGVAKRRDRSVVIIGEDFAFGV